MNWYCKKQLQKKATRVLLSWQFIDILQKSLLIHTKHCFLGIIDIKEHSGDRWFSWVGTLRPAKIDMEMIAK